MAEISSPLSGPVLTGYPTRVITYRNQTTRYGVQPDPVKYPSTATTPKPTVQTKINVIEAKVPDPAAYTRTTTRASSTAGWGLGILVLVTFLLLGGGK